MPRKRHKPEEIVVNLRPVDVLVWQGQAVTDAIRSIGVPEHVRSDSGPEFVAKAVQAWTGAVGAKTACFARPGSGGLRARHDRTGGCAIQASYAARVGAQANRTLTFNPDLAVGADRRRLDCRLPPPGAVR